MIKFIAIIDWCTDFRNDFQLVELEAKNIYEAMEEAEKLFNENVYLITIAEKINKQYKEGRLRKIDYIERITNRKHGWKTEYNDIWTVCQLENEKWLEIKSC